MTSAVGVAGAQRGNQPRAGVVGEPIGAATQPTPDPVERIVSAATVPGGVLLDPAAYLIEAGQAQSHDVEGVQHPDRLGQAGGQGGRVAPIGVQRSVTDLIAPVRLPLVEPGREARGGVVIDDVEQPGRPARGQVGDASDKPSRAGRGGGEHGGLIHPDRFDPVESVRVLDQRFTLDNDLAHHGVPAHPQLSGGVRDHPVAVADLRHRPGGRSSGQTRPRRDRLMGLGPGPGRAQLMRAAPHPLDPANHHRPPGQGQIAHPHRSAVLGPGHRPALRARHEIRSGLHQNLQLTTGIGGGQQHEPVQPEQRTGQRPSSVHIHLGLPSRSCHLVVITDREGPRPTSRHLKHRRVGPGLRPPPSFLTKSRKTSDRAPSLGGYFPAHVSQRLRRTSGAVMKLTQ